MSSTAMETDHADAETNDNNPTQPKKMHMQLLSEVTIHPLVLLSAADHYHRVARGTRKRVVGILLGKVFQGKVEALSSFAVPFEEDSKNPVRRKAGDVLFLFVLH